MANKQIKNFKKPYHGGKLALVIFFFCFFVLFDFVCFFLII